MARINAKSAFTFVMSFAVLWCLAAQAFAQPRPLISQRSMSFELVESRAFSGLSDDLTARLIEDNLDIKWIMASGRFTADTPRKFEQFLRRICTQDDICDPQKDGVRTIMFNSKGGNLSAGIRLGRMVRERGFQTAVAASFTDSEAANPEGGCYSACAYAFLGGVYRRIEHFYEADIEIFDKSGIIAVHRWSPDGQSSGNDAQETLDTDNEGYFKACSKLKRTTDRIQCVDALLIEYLGEMGIDKQFFTISSKTASLQDLTIDQLRDWNVISNLALSDWDTVMWNDKYAARAISKDPDNPYLHMILYCEAPSSVTVRISYQFADQEALMDRSGWIMSFNGKNVFLENPHYMLMDSALEILLQPERKDIPLDGDYLEITARPLQKATVADGNHLQLSAFAGESEVGLLRGVLRNCNISDIFRP